MALQSIPQLWTVFQITAYAIAIIVAMLVAGMGVWFTVRKRVKEFQRQEGDDILRPYEQATQAYKIRVEQLEKDNERLSSELAFANAEVVRLRGRVRELEQDYLGLAQINQRQQGELDELKRRMDTLRREK